MHTADLAFLAPEQLHSAARVGPQADIYSLGVITYALLTGALPFAGEDAVTLRRAVVDEIPIPPEAINPAIPPGMAYVLKCVLAKEPDMRYATASDFAAALHEGQMWMPGLPDSAPSTGAAGRRQAAQYGDTAARAHLWLWAPYCAARAGRDRHRNRLLASGPCIPHLRRHAPTDRIWPSPAQPTPRVSVVIARSDDATPTPAGFENPVFITATALARATSCHGHCVGECRRRRRGASTATPPAATAAASSAAAPPTATATDKAAPTDIPAMAPTAHRHQPQFQPARLRPARTAATGSSDDTATPTVSDRRPDGRGSNPDPDRHSDANRYRHRAGHGDSHGDGHGDSAATHVD